MPRTPSTTRTTTNPLDPTNPLPQPSGNTLPVPNPLPTDTVDPNAPAPTTHTTSTNPATGTTGSTVPPPATPDTPFTGAGAAGPAGEAFRASTEGQRLIEEDRARTLARATALGQNFTSDGQPTGVDGGTGFDPTNAPAGFDPAKWADPNHQTPKYVVGRITQSYPNTPEGRAAAAAEILAAFPGAEQIDEDDFFFPGIGIVDIYGDAAGGTFSPQWIPDSEQQPTAGAGGGLPDLSTLLSSFSGGPATGGTGGTGGGAMNLPDPFGGTGVQLVNGDWVPADHPLANSPGAVAGGQPQNPSGSNQATPPPTSNAPPVVAGGTPLPQTPAAFQDPGLNTGITQSDGVGGGGLNPDLIAALRGLLDPTSGFNETRLNQRRESLREGLEGSRTVEQQSLEAQLAERGLTGGAAASANARLGERLGVQHATQLRDLVSDESQRADERQAQAISVAAGLSIEDARRTIDRFNALTDRRNVEGNLSLGQDRLGLDRDRLSLDDFLGRGQLDLGQQRISLDDLLGRGNLALGNATLASNYALGQGRLALDQQGQNSLTPAQIMAMIQGILSGNNNSAPQA